MKALWFTDLHLRPTQKESGAKLLSFILKTAQERKPGVAIITGDIFHTKDNVQLTLMTTFKEFLIELSQICKVVVIPGNHDYGSEYSSHSLDYLKKMDNVVIVDTSYKITDKVGIISYARKPDRFQFLMNELGPVETLFGHFDLNGFNLGSGWEEQESWSDPEVFKSYSSLKFVNSGHYHLAQEKILNDVRFVFCGTGYTTDFGESDQEKRVCIYDLETNEIESISTGLTLHKTLRIDVGADLPEIPQDEIANGVEYRVVIKGTQKQINLWQNSKEMPRNYPGRVSYDFITEVDERLDISSTDDSVDILSKYVSNEFSKNKETVKNSNLNEERLLKMGQRLMAVVGRK